MCQLYIYIYTYILYIIFIHIYNIYTYIIYNIYTYIIYNIYTYIYIYTYIIYSTGLIPSSDYRKDDERSRLNTLLRLEVTSDWVSTVLPDTLVLLHSVEGTALSLAESADDSILKNDLRWLLKLHQQTQKTNASDGMFVCYVWVLFIS